MTSTNTSKTSMAEVDRAIRHLEQALASYTAAQGALLECHQDPATTPDAHEAAAEAVHGARIALSGTMTNLRRTWIAELDKLHKPAEVTE